MIDYTEKDTIAALLPIVLDDNRAPHLQQFLQVLYYFEYTTTSIYYYILYQYIFT